MNRIAIKREVAFDLVETAWGWLGVASTERGICGLTLPVCYPGEALASLGRDWPEGRCAESAVTQSVERQLLRYFQGEPVRFEAALDLPLHPPFWHRVWNVVKEIPYGETRSYGEIARSAAAAGAARAVGGAMASNPVAIIIPCHRVVGSNGRLVGFGGGLEMKRRLLEMEQGAGAGVYSRAHK